MRRVGGAALVLCGLAATAGEAVAGSRPACAPGGVRIGAAEVVDGRAFVQPAGGAMEIALFPGMSVCSGDRIRTGDDGRVEITFDGRNTTLGTTANSTLVIPEAGAGAGAPADVRLESGLMRFLSSVRDAFAIETRQGTAGIDGTEAVIASTGDGGAMLVLVREGTVTVSSGAARQALGAGDAAIAARGAIRPATAEDAPAPFRALIADPAGATDWAIHYPPILLAGEAKDPSLDAALARLDADDPDGAEALLSRIATDTRAGPAARALGALIASLRGRPADAERLALAAIAAAPDFGAGHVALSYARQAAGEIRAAVASAKRATEVSPGDAYAWARLAELRLTRGDLRGAERAIARSLEIDRTSLALAIRGFAALTRDDLGTARLAFADAIALEDADPLPRLGQGLAQIRDGALASGRGAIELAAALSPREAGMRSWLGRAYFAEGLPDKALNQFALGREIDPDDPVPPLFAATVKAVENRPVEALADLKAAESLSRDVLRDERGLGEDRAARASVLGRVLDDLGFTEQARDAAARASEDDPTSGAAHRVLAELASGDPGLTLARSSAALKATLLSPPNLAPIDPALSEADLAILEPRGPERATFVEYSPFFTQDGAALSLTGFGGTQRTFGDLISGRVLAEGVSLGIAQYHYETNGFGENNDVRHDLVTVEGKARVTPGLTLFGTYRYRDSAGGDRELPFDLADLNQTAMQRDERHLGRIGFHAGFGPDHDLIGTASYQAAAQDTGFTEDISEQAASFNWTAADIQLQHIGRFGPVETQIGLSHSEAEVDSTLSQTLDLGFTRLAPTTVAETDRLRQTVIYGYARHRFGEIPFVDAIDLTAGVSLDRFESDAGPGSKTRVNPKAGIRVALSPRAGLRAAYMQTVTPLFLFDEQIEPVTIAGFAQYRPEPAGARVRQVALGADFAATRALDLGAEAAWRWIAAPGGAADGSEAEIEEREWSLFANAALGARSAASLRLRRAWATSDLAGDIDTHSVTELGGEIRHFHPSGLFAMASLSHVWHDFEAANEGGDDAFVLATLSAGYRLPRQRGVLSVDIGNALDQSVRFQARPLRVLGALAPAEPSFPRELSVFAKLSLRF